MSSQRCKRCGAELRGWWPEGLCSVCIARAKGTAEAVRRKLGGDLRLRRQVYRYLVKAPDLTYREMLEIAQGWAASRTGGPSAGPLAGDGPPAGVTPR